MTTGPDDKSVGVVRLASWQVHPVGGTELPPWLACYLVKINYSLLEVADGLGIPWFEVALSFPETVKVLDALPHTTAPNRGHSYVVNRYANLVPCQSNTADVHLPEQDSAVSTFGVGTSGVRWLHHGGGRRPAGDRVAWVVLTAPSELPHLPVEATSRFNTSAGDLHSWPVALPVGFTVDLGRQSGIEALPDSPSPSGGRQETAWPWIPRVFISYAYDSEEHVAMVRAFAEFLIGQGFDVRIDHLDCTVRRDWGLWAPREMRNADYVIVIASPMCAAVGDGAVLESEHLGMQSEMALLRELVHRHRQEWTRRTLPVVLPGITPDDIPDFLQPYCADHYLVTELTAEGAADLLSVLRHDPRSMESSPSGKSGAA
ncbi:SEFIR domain-containing protein [Actinokineospora spheciospongiae]|uniref:SEFIR domain-containing protein n=1 Tax=Actinokineospora spheciospongiae TaxID=909613 RepID=UPI000D8E506F|nr:SEFIR domain-containing protein [Actinokineospora spheciospongiae]PWW58356.1 SEFIR domain-containing protein [Actinokineospora spheciospongiae]